MIERERERERDSQGKGFKGQEVLHHAKKRAPFPGIQ